MVCITHGGNTVRKSIMTLALTGAALLGGAIPAAAALADPAAPDVAVHPSVNCDTRWVTLQLENNTDVTKTFTLYYINDRMEDVKVRAHHVVPTHTDYRLIEGGGVIVDGYWLPLRPAVQWPSNCLK